MSVTVMRMCKIATMTATAINLEQELHRMQATYRRHLHAACTHLSVGCTDCSPLQYTVIQAVQLHQVPTATANQHHNREHASFRIRTGNSDNQHACCRTCTSAGAATATDGRDLIAAAPFTNPQLQMPETSPECYMLSQLLFCLREAASW